MPRVRKPDARELDSKSIRKRVGKSINEPRTGLQRLFLTPGELPGMKNNAKGPRTSSKRRRMENIRKRGGNSWTHVFFCNSEERFSRIHWESQRNSGNAKNGVSDPLETKTKFVVQTMYVSQWVRAKHVPKGVRTTRTQTCRPYGYTACDGFLVSLSFQTISRNT